MCGAQPHKEGNQSVETDSWSLKPEFSEIVNFRLRPDGPSTSRREMMIDVFSRLNTIFIGVGAICRISLDYHSRTPSPENLLNLWEIHSLLRLPHFSQPVPS